MPEITWTIENIDEAIIFAKNRFLEKDRYLLEVNVNERTMTSKFAMYLQEIFTDWNVDCEYNRDGKVPKQIDNGRVFPDIVVHKRGHRGAGYNLCVIEAKINTDRRGTIDDKNRLPLYKIEIGFQFAVLIVLNVTDLTISHEFV